MEIRNLITFTKVAETQSLSKAAKALGYAQSTVTMQMQQLEQELGSQLYERVGKQIRITQTGQEFLGYAGAIIRMSKEALMVGKQNTFSVSGSLRLGILSPLSQIFSRRIAQFLQSYPQVALDAQTIQEPEDLLSLLRHNEIDLALTLGTLYTDDDLIHALEDQQVPIHCYTNKTHPLASQTNLRPEDLSQYSFIRTGSFTGIPDNMLISSSSRQIQISAPALALSIAASMSSTKENAAIVLAPDLLVQQHPDANHLVRLDYECDGPALWLQTLHHRNKWLTGAMKAWLSDQQNFSVSL